MALRRAAARFAPRTSTARPRSTAEARQVVV
jgi:hypothetical protein